MDKIVFFLLPSFFGAISALCAFKGIRNRKAPGRGGYIVESESPRIFRLAILTYVIAALFFFGWGFAILFGFIPLGPPH